MRSNISYVICLVRSIGALKSWRRSPASEFWLPQQSLQSLLVITKRMRASAETRRNFWNNARRRALGDVTRRFFRSGVLSAIVAKWAGSSGCCPGLPGGAESPPRPAGRSSYGVAEDDAGICLP